MFKKVKYPIGQVKVSDKFKTIKLMSRKYSISSMCKLIGVSRSGYYKWLSYSKKSSDRGIKDRIIKDYIIEIHKKYRGTYGRKRICTYLNKILDSPINHKRVYRLMKELGIKSIIRKKVYRRKFKSYEVYDNILNREFRANQPLEKICMDITYIPIGKKFLYMNVAKDLFNGEIVAYEISTKMDTKLVNKTVNQLINMNLAKDCILHTDQGSQYTSRSYSKRLKDNGIIQSMSRRGNCWDNAPIESFFSHFKSELIYLIDTTDPKEMISLINDYIYFYNNERIQLKNGMSPIEYRTHSA
ncbi:IS3 family transposase [Clostridioides difficile]|uniref:IS3 family transposase n=1 Tax=Clostridioides difficile TaxID=1496 RepID=UPI002882DC70|nr:IS3 family transposase [Clostridioides difficile]